MIRTPGADLDRIQTPHARDGDEQRGAPAPARLDEFVGQEALKAQLELSIRAAAGPRRGARPRAARRPARPRQDVAGADRRRASSSVAVRADRRPGAGAQGRHRGLPDRARAARGLLRRRDPPPPARGRGDVLSRDGGPPAADHASAPGAGAQVVTLDLPPFTLIGATTRAGLLTTPLRDRFGIQHRLDHYGPDDLAAIVVRSAGCSTSRSHLDGARAIAERAAAPRASPTACSSACATTRRCTAAARSTPRPPTPRSTCSRSTTRAWTGWTARSSRRSASGSPAARSGLSTLAVAVQEEAGHDRGRLRAVPAAARLHPAHAARALRDARTRSAHLGLEPPANDSSVVLSRSP